MIHNRTVIILELECLRPGALSGHGRYSVDSQYAIVDSALLVVQNWRLSQTMLDEVGEVLGRNIACYQATYIEENGTFSEDSVAGAAAQIRRKNFKP